MINDLKKESKGFRKGQFFSYDGIVAGILFILLLTLLYTYWNSLRSTISVRIDDSTRIAMSVSTLLLTPGNPVNWNYTNFNQLGLTVGANTIRISEEKVGNLSLVAMDYNKLKEKLGVGPYEISIQIGTEVIGLPPSGETSKVTISRPVIFRDSLQNLSVTIWSRK